VTATRSPDRLYDLLPAVYREQDADEGLALRALLRIVASQVDLVEQDVAGLWNDLFIETCRRWVIPYIGDLVSNNLLYDAGRIREEDTAAAIFTDLVGPDLRPPIDIRTRADVAKTIYYRRRKGTLPMLEELARDVTGWAVHAVEFFELLGWTQHLEHFRPQAAWFDIRSLERDERVDGPFDEASHSVDVRPISQFQGWHSIKNIGFFIWRLESNRLLNVPARVANAAWQFRFSPLGNDMPLFSRLRREGDETGLSTELHVPGPIRRAYFARDLAEHRPQPPAPPPDFTDLYGMVEGPPLTLEENPDASLFAICDGTPVPPAQVFCRRLDPWPTARPSGAVIEIDVAVGRIAVGDGFAAGPALDVTCHYGFPARLGGGTYPRRQWLRRIDPTSPLVRFTVVEGAAAPPNQFASVVDAITHWDTNGKPDAVIVIEDSRIYALPGQIALTDESDLTIEAADGERPLLQTDPAGLSVTAPGTNPDPEVRGALTLSGVVVEGFVQVEGDLNRLRLIHSTLVPGRTIAEGAPVPADTWSIAIDGTSASGETINAHLRLQLAFSVAGPIVCPEHADRIEILDSIVEGLGGAAIAAGGGTAAAPLSIERSTVLGTTTVHELEASESIFTDTVLVDRRQTGCVRFSYVPPGSKTPRRYRCQPDLGVRKALDEALALDPTLTQAQQNAIRDYVDGWLQPSFTARQYGRPEYCQLRLACPAEIRTGAADGSEMGVYCHLKQPQRESNLRIRLDEYLPFGLEAGAIYVT
jgi:hypothetical protein